MIGYHLMSERWAIEALHARRLKLALLEDMNDPFELLGVELADADDRREFRRLKAEMHETIGVLCFSRSWNNPVLWSHYGDRHRGIGLGFEIPDAWIKEVTYHGKRLPASLERDLGVEDRGDMGLTLLTTKYEHWRYEDEVRMIIKLEDAQRESGLYFLPFCKALVLREIVVGPRCNQTIKGIRSVLTVGDRDATVVKARLAFRSFRVVKRRDVS